MRGTCWFLFKLPKLLKTCVFQGCAQVSLADFNVQATTQKWYNILSLLEEPSKQADRPLESREKQQEMDRQTGKEESSDDSTIISSQTSTLTRNQETVVPTGMNLNFDELYNCLKTTAEYDSADDSEEEEDDIEEEEEEEEEARPLEFRPNEKLDVVHEHDTDEERYLGKCKLVISQDFV